MCCRIMKRFHAFLSWLGIPKHLFNDYKVCLLVLCLIYTQKHYQCDHPFNNSMSRCIKFAKLSRSSPLNSELLETGISSWKHKDIVQIMIDDERLPKQCFNSGSSRRLPRSVRQRRGTSLVRSCTS